MGTSMASSPPITRWQLVREWPPGFGGVERVAHELACAWTDRTGTCRVCCLRPPRTAGDPLEVPYPRQRLPHLSFGELLLPLPGPALLRLLLSARPLHVHLPCPGLLALAVLARLLRPRRRISFHWHAWLARRRGASGRFQGLYQRLAVGWMARAADAVVTTSPPLLETLRERGVPAGRLRLLPCCLSERAEQLAGRTWRHRRRRRPAAGAGFRVIVIGRLDSYKRVDWLIDAFSMGPASRLDVVGDGPLRAGLERQAAAVRRRRPDQRIRFHGRLGETRKFALLGRADLLVLPADRCNEAFGIVQLEAMACGVPALAFELEHSGAAWVNGLVRPPHIPPRDRADLAAAIRELAAEPALRRHDGIAARHRYLSRFRRRRWLRSLQSLGR
jgi:glycosyltransferase involved in cell wall biosynthesis